MPLTASIAPSTAAESATGRSSSIGSPAECSTSMRASSCSDGYPTERRIAKRSSCASGSGNVPSYSIGFCVAITMNGRARGCVWPSIVTCTSCMHSSSADWVFGDARLISSTRTRFANTGPGRNENSFVCRLKTFTPVMSDGRRSGVAWMRANSQSTERASDFASIVFPTPGKSSRITWPSHSMASTQRSISVSGAWITRRTFAITARAVSPASTIASAGTFSFRLRASKGDPPVAGELRAGLYGRGGRPVPTGGLRAGRRGQGGDRVPHGRGAGALGAAADGDRAVGGDQRELVVGGVEADAGAAHVVQDDHVDALPGELGARPLLAARAVLGGEPDEHLPGPPAGAELGEDVGGRLERERPRPAVLGALAGERLGGAVV